MMGWIISSSALIGLVALLRRVLRGRISLRLQYALWALVLVRLLVPFRFGSTLFSVDNLTARLGQQPAVQIVSQLSRTELPRMSWRAAYEQVAEEYAQKGVDITGMTPKEYEAVDYEIRYRMRGDVTLTDVLRRVWLAGGALLAAAFLVCNLRFSRRLRRTRRRLWGVSAPLPVYRSPAVETPCLFGLFRPAVYLTGEALADATVLRHALAHETTHFRHGDHVWSLLRCLCLALHWYNPLVWLAASLSRRDGELACDEGTLARLGEGERAAYGNTLIDLTCGRRTAASLFRTATTMGDGKKQLKERILLIAKKPKMFTATAVAVLLICAAAVGCTFTGARESAGAPEAPTASTAPSAPATAPSESPAPVESLTPNENPTPVPLEETVWPEGVCRLCEAVDETRCLLLFSGPDGGNTFYLYDREARRCQPIPGVEALWEWPDYHVAAADGGEILYQTGGGRLFSLREKDGKWTQTERTKSESDPYVISPDGTKYAMRQGGAVKIFDLERDVLLAERRDVSGVRGMAWSEDGSRLAMVTEGGAGAAVWELDTDALSVYDAGRDPNTPDNWVDILRAWPAGEGFLLVEYLCEMGGALVIWDTVRDAPSGKLEAAGELTLLDLSGDTLLYAAQPEDGGDHTLNTYHCASKEGKELDRSKAPYTAGCLDRRTGQPLVFRYEAAP